MLCTVANIKGGVAKSSVAVSLGAMAAHDGLSVTIIDTEKEGGASEWGSARTEAGLEPSVPVVAVRSDQPAKTVAAHAATDELVIVDIGAYSAKSLVQCATLSDIVLVPCGPQEFELAKTIKTLEALADTRVPTYVLLTRVSNHPKAKEVQQLRDYFEAAGAQVLQAVLPRRKAWEQVGSGRGIHEVPGGEAAAAELRAVYEEVAQLVGAEA